MAPSGRWLYPHITFPSYSKLWHGLRVYLDLPRQLYDLFTSHYAPASEEGLKDAPGWPALDPCSVTAEAPFTLLERWSDGNASRPVPFCQPEELFHQVLGSREESSRTKNKGRTKRGWESAGAFSFHCNKVDQTVRFRNDVEPSPAPRRARVDWL